MTQQDNNYVLDITLYKATYVRLKYVRHVQFKYYEAPQIIIIIIINYDYYGGSYYAYMCV